jgi:hypothetical protein
MILRYSSQEVNHLIDPAFQHECSTYGRLGFDGPSFRI